MSPETRDFLRHFVILLAAFVLVLAFIEGTIVGAYALFGPGDAWLFVWAAGWLVGLAAVVSWNLTR